MKTIVDKYFPIQAVFSLQMPKNAQILHVGMQTATPCIWALVDTELPLTQREFFLFRTGMPIAIQELKFVATFVEGSTNWHLFEKKIYEKGKL